VGAGGDHPRPPLTGRPQIGFPSPRDLRVAPLQPLPTRPRPHQLTTTTDRGVPISGISSIMPDLALSSPAIGGVGERRYASPVCGVCEVSFPVGSGGCGCQTGSVHGSDLLSNAQLGRNRKGQSFSCNSRSISDAGNGSTVCLVSGHGFDPDFACGRPDSQEAWIHDPDHEIGGSDVPDAGFVEW
jgi:hypothetical protein